MQAACAPFFLAAASEGRNPAAPTMAAMPPEKREVLVMSRFLDLKYEEIASVLKCETGAVKVRVYRALRELSDRFFALCGDRAS